MFVEFDEKLYNELKDKAFAAGVHVVHQIFNDGGKLYGFTVAWKRVSERLDSSLIEVAVTYTAPSETKFVKRLGTFHALYNFENCETIRLPIGHADNEVVVKRLRTMFSAPLCFRERT